MFEWLQIVGAVNSNDLLAESPSLAGIAETASTDIHIAMPTSYANQLSHPSPINNSSTTQCRFYHINIQTSTFTSFQPLIY